MDNVEAQFNEITSQSPEELLAELAKLRESLAPVVSAIEEAKEAKSVYDADIKEHNDAIRKLKEKQHEIDRVVWDSQKQMRDLERKIASAERRFQEAEAAKELRKQYNELYDEFERLTAGAPWREWALDHQIKGAKQLAASKRAILADKRGLGKTLTSLIYCDMVQSKKVIAVVPNDTMDNFLREIHHWAPHRAVSTIKIGGMAKGERDVILNMLLPNMGEFLIVINFEAWRRDPDLIKSLVALQPDTLIIDEAHNAKNRKTKAYQGLATITTSNNQCSKCQSANIGMVEDYYGRVSNIHCRDCKATPVDFFDFNSVKHVLPMTGTPILNKPQDLFALLSLIDPKTFSSEQDFLYDYCTQDFYTNKWKFRPGGLERLTKQLSARFVMRDRNSAGIEIPPQEVQYMNITLDPNEYPEQARMLRALNEQAMIILEGNEGLPVPYLIALITRKRQATVWGAGIEFKDRDGVVVYRADCNESIKLDKTIDLASGNGNGPEGLIPDMIGEFDPDTQRWVDGERIVVFSAFNAPLAELGRRLEAANIPYAMMTGETPVERRNEIVLDFDAKTASKENYKYQVVLCNYAVGGVGLNLTSASQIICLDEVWSPGKMDQAFGRIDRIGQERRTGVTILRVNNSIDTFMAGLIDAKADMIDGFESEISLQAGLLDYLEGDNF